MRWSDVFWSTYGIVANTTIEATANTLNAVGSLACLAGGAGSTFSHVINETFNASYYTSGIATGVVRLDAEISQLNYSLNDSIPFQDSDHKSGGLSYDFKDYLHPDTIKLASALLFSSGTVLRALGANVKLWHQGRVDKAYYKDRYGIDISSPSKREYFCANVESLTGSITFASLSALVTAGFVNSGVISSKQNVTYPLKSEHWVNSSSYRGPVNQLSRPLNYYFEKNVTIELFGEHILAKLGARIDAVANATYGGGLFFQSSKDYSNPPVAIPAIPGIIAYQTNTFFFKKSIQLRDDRIHQTLDDESLLPRVQ